ncbi:MAG: hypothetical protein K5654_01150 [Lachnospiraceae bacterium]|nr:hypothetical protein [Lachnospiraceae bacterium]
MSIIDMIGIKSGVSIGICLIAIAMTLIQIAPIKLNPWDRILTWLGNHMNADIVKRVDVIEAKLDEHIRESSDERIRKVRADILDFGNACMNGRPHTKEEFEFVISECDQYEKHIEKTGGKNGVATATITEIRRLYEKGLHDNSFMKEGENETGIH